MSRTLRTNNAARDVEEQVHGARPPAPAYAGSKFALEAVSDSLRRGRRARGQTRRRRTRRGQNRDGRARRATTHRLNANMTTAQLQRYGELTEAISAQARSFANTTEAIAARPKTRESTYPDQDQLSRLCGAVGGEGTKGGHDLLAV